VYLYIIGWRVTVFGDAWLGVFTATGGFYCVFGNSCPSSEGSAGWPKGLGACRLRVFFLSPAGALRLVDGVEMPPRVAALLGAIVSALGIGNRL